MRNREEFKSLVYEKRDKLLYEELEEKKKLNKRKKIYAALSSAMAVVIVMAVVIPNAGKWMNMGGMPVANESPENGKNDGNGGFDRDQIVGAPDMAPADSEAAEEYEEPIETELAEMCPIETAGGIFWPEEEPTVEDVYPEASSPIQVKFTATLSTEPAGRVSMMEGGVGQLEGEELGAEILIITDYEALKLTFESLCSTTHTAAVFGGDDIFREDRVILVIERFGGDPSENEVTYQCVGVEDGTLYLVRKHADRGEYDVPAVEVRCVDFVVLNKYGYDMSLIENIVITK